MKEYQVNVNGNIISIIQDDDGKFIIPDCINELQQIGTQLKPAYEPIIVARKPFNGSCVDNVLKYGVGGINIDECRVSHNEPIKTTNRKQKDGDVFNTDSCGFDNTKNHLASADSRGRFPSNIILTYDETDEDEVCGEFPNTKSQKPRNISNEYTSKIYGKYRERQENYIYNDSGSASRYFYCAKASKRDRDDGINTGRNIHTTVKPVSLMQYLVRLVSPKGSTILDPFMGSGSTGKAVAYENNDRNANYSFIGIELQPEYFEIAKQRIDFADNDRESIETIIQNDPVVENRVIKKNAKKSRLF